MAAPNILFVMTDHTNARALAPGSPCRKPHLDRLAGGAVRFARCYTTNAICSPARASLMTGLYPSTHGIWDCTHTQPHGWVRLAPGHPHFAQTLAAAGYRNGYFGKWHVENTGKLDEFGWHESDQRCALAPHKIIPGSAIQVKTPGYRDYLLAAASADDGCLQHPAFNRGIEFIQQQTAAGKPFCCFISTAEPHDPYIPPRKFLDQYDLATLPVSPTLRADPAGKPEVVKRQREIWRNLSDADWRQVTAAYYASISFLDSEVGRIIAALKETGQYDNAIIVFTADHGDMLGGHGLATKGVGTGYEEVYNIPLIMRVPGSRQREANELAGILDVGPTLLDYCGLDPLPGAQGRSLRPVLEGRAAAGDWQDAYAEFYGQRFVHTQRITWHADWKYIFAPAGTDELYNLATDPQEQQNLAGNPAYRAVLEDMTSRMWQKMKTIGDMSLFQSQYATLRVAPVGPEA